MRRLYSVSPSLLEKVIIPLWLVFREMKLRIWYWMYNLRCSYDDAGLVISYNKIFHKCANVNPFNFARRFGPYNVFIVLFNNNIEHNIFTQALMRVSSANRSG